MDANEQRARDVEALQGAHKFIAGRYGEHDGWAQAIARAIAALAQQVPADGGCSPEDRFEQYVAAGIARSPDALRELGEYLTRVLDEDEWPTADRLLLQLATATQQAPQPVVDGDTAKCPDCDGRGWNQEVDDSRLESVVGSENAAVAYIVDCEACKPAATQPQQPKPVVDGLREFLGKLVRLEWEAWAREQPNPKPSWLTPWDELSEPEREVDRRIGERIYSTVNPNGFATPASQPQQGAVDDAFNAGWRMAAAWADRDDLLADMDSSAYKTERAAALAAHGKGG